MRQCVVRRATLITLVALIVGAGAAQAQEKVTLVCKAQAGQVVRYRDVITQERVVGGQKISAETRAVEKMTITEVQSSGMIIREVELESVEQIVNGEKQPNTEDKTRHTYTIRPDGSLANYKSTSGDPNQDKEQVRYYPATTVIFPAKPVGVGDKWSQEIKTDAALGQHAGKADFEVLGAETLDGAATLKIKVTYTETQDTPPLSTQGTVWVEKSTGDPVVSEFTVENPTPDGLIESKLRQERISGSSLGGGKAASPETSQAKTIDETVKDYDKLPGLFPIYRKKESGRDTVFMEIPESRLDKLLLLQATASTGTSGQVVAGQPINDLLFKFARLDAERIVMVTPNIAFRAAENTPIGRAVRRSFADGYLNAFRIEARQPDRKSLLINVTDLFQGDIAQVSQIFAPGGGNAFGAAAGGSYSLDRDKTYIAAVKNFPENLVVQTAYHFTGGGSPFKSPTLADIRSVPFNVDYNLFLIPDDGYKPRLADPRIGYFTVDFRDYNNDDRDNALVHYIQRWNLEKANPSAPVSPPKKPIVFWLDNAIPLEYRDAVREGLLFWNKAFEKLGYKDAIVVKQMPDNADWDHADMRYNTIRWVTSPGSVYAVAQFRINPINGEILNADITVDANWTRAIKNDRKTQVDPASWFAPPSQADARAIDPRRCDLADGLMDQAWYGYLALSMLSPPGHEPDARDFTHVYLRELVAHEMGHCLGLRHNFVASTYHSMEELKDPRLVHDTGVCASVMDYTPFNIAALKTHNVDYFTSTIGPYDIWAIEYGYTPVYNAKTPDDEMPALKRIASRCNEPGLAYESDEITDQFDPDVTRYDLGRDPLAYWKRTLETTRFLIFHLGERLPKRGESYWEFTRNFNGLLNQYSRAAYMVSRYIGGLHVNRNHRGDPGEHPTLAPIDAAEQKQALDLLATYIFAENAFAFPQSYFTKMAPDPMQDYLSAIFGGGQDFPLRDTMSSIQQADLRLLLSPGVLKRIANNEFKIGDATKTLTLPTLFHTLGNAIWSELDARKDISALRRQLQRAYLDTTIAMVVNPASGVPDDARMLAWDQLRQLKGKLQSAQQAHHDEYTRIHLDESLMRVKRALDAKLVIDANPLTPNRPF